MMKLSANFKMSPMFLKVQLKNTEKHWNEKALCFFNEQLSQKWYSEKSPMIEKCPN